MTGISFLAMAGGLVVLGLMPLPKDKQLAKASQGAGAALFAGGLLGVLWEIVPAVA
ncbi:hypothetical protein [Novosphingobium sp. TH158]|uniref:hypothetical protein n=1 Tax=Novosphingobium sp. TH158 TaxID=2067455 RepID=UPI0013046155|nr:hypothetical protein [Novosphingobium sp. TH158]